MSRIGRLPITIPDKVKVNVQPGLVHVEGPKGKVTQKLDREMKITVAEGQVRVERPNDSRRSRQLHGLSRTLVANMITGVTTGYSKALEISGVGYRVQAKGSNLEFSLGFSHPITVSPPEGITLRVESPTRLVVEGIDKQQVGEVAANIRKLRKPDPYKGKGLRYSGEHIRRKVGKAGK